MKRYNVTHGATGTPAYRAYMNMIQRCNNPKCRIYKYYGAKGIKVSKGWMRGFEYFIADMGKRPDGFTLERKNVNKGYSKSNCKWASNIDQQNNRTNNRRITYNGLTLTLAQWGKKLNLQYQTIIDRIKKGLPMDEVLSPTNVDEPGDNFTRVKYRNSSGKLISYRRRKDSYFPGINRYQ